MSRYIDAEVAIEKCNKLLNNSHSCPSPEILKGVEIVRDLILTDCETGVPTADVKKVVRCRNCKFNIDDWYGENDYTCIFDYRVHHPDNYCSSAVPNEE